MPHHAQLEALMASLVDHGYCLCEVITDAQGTVTDYRFVEVSANFSEMSGLGDVLGRTALDVMPGLEQHWFDTYARVVAGESLRVQNYAADLGRWFDVFAAPVTPHGRFLMVFRDVTPQRRAEMEREAAREQAENLLLELNHRVMNTMAMITSIVRMEGQSLAEGSDGAEAIARLQTRLAAVSSLYRALSRAARTASVPAREYLAAVAESVIEAVAERERIALTVEIADIDLRTEQAAPLGLALNELLTNALKYAFPDRRRGAIRVRLASEGARLRLSVADDGVGAEASANARGAGSQPGHGVGAMLIEAFAEQLEGHLSRESCAEGMIVRLDFPR